MIDRDVRVYLAQLLQSLDAVHLGHPDIEYDDVVALVLDLPEGLGRPVGGLHREGTCESIGYRLPGAVFVVDDEHPPGLDRPVLDDGRVGDHQADLSPAEMART